MSYRRAGVYGLTDKEFAALRQRAGGACELCGATKALHVDHDHVTSLVRGLVCAVCNHRLAKVDSGAYAASEAERRYLARPQIGSGHAHAPLKTFRASDDLWNAAKAEANGEPLSAVILRLLRAWLAS